MKILITGSNGMLGRALCRELGDRHGLAGLDIVKVSRDISAEKFIFCDITDQEKVIAAIVGLKPEIVIHAAAYTDVDGCETDQRKAELVNALGTKNVARACAECGSLLIYISTDFVFDGEKKSAYIEDDRPNPISIYGQSKLEGERYARSIAGKSAIIRSSWLFGPGDRNFVDSILEKAQNQTEIKVVNDQFGSPTYTNDLAQAIGRLISMARGLNGIYHITNSGHCSWYELACTIKQLAKLNINILPISSEQYSSPTRRPKMSILENRRYRKSTGGLLRSWQEALKEYLLR